MIPFCQWFMAQVYIATYESLKKTNAKKKNRLTSTNWQRNATIKMLRPPEQPTTKDATSSSNQTALKPRLPRAGPKGDESPKIVRWMSMARRRRKNVGLGESRNPPVPLQTSRQRNGADRRKRRLPRLRLRLVVELKSLRPKNKIRRWIRTRSGAVLRAYCSII